MKYLRHAQRDHHNHEPGQCSLFYLLCTYLCFTTVNGLLEVHQQMHYCIVFQLHLQRTLGITLFSKLLIIMDQEKLYVKNDLT